MPLEDRKTVARVKRLRPVLLVGVALVVMGLFGVQALGATRLVGRAGRQAWASRIVSPSSGGVFLGRSVRVVVKLGSGVRSFRATLGSRVVTGAFRSADGGAERVARLRYGAANGLRFGRNTVYVQTTGRARTQRWFTQRSFVLARGVAGLLKAAVAEPTCGTGSRVTVALGRPGLGLSVRINRGRHRPVHGGRVRSLTATADDGLRPGKNVITVQALDATRGGYARRQLRLRMPFGTPVAGAGSARRARAGRIVRFSAAASVAARPGEKLRYKWTIVKRPRGSRARLHKATSAHPFLRTDRPGRYVLRVTVLQVPVHALTAGLGHVHLLCSSDGATATTSLSATPSAPPIGVAVDTIATQNGNSGMQVGSQFYAAPTQGDALQLLVLNRGTLAMVQNTSFTNDPAGATSLLNAVKPLTSGDLVLISKPDAKTTSGTSATAATTINQALAKIGVAAVPVAVSTGNTACLQSGQCSSFSTIGIPGLPAGQGNLNAGLAAVPGSGLAAGDLHGYFQENLTGTDFAFISVERVPFDTGDPGADPAVVTVGSNEAGSSAPKHTYTSANLSGGAGFFVVVLDAGSLALKQQGTYSTGTPPNSGVGTLTAMFGVLVQWQNDPAAVVIVRSIGSVGRLSSGTGQTGTWDFVAGALQQLGGSLFYFDALDGKNSTQYAQVGPAGTPGYPNPWTQVASKERSGTGRLTGLLARNSSGQLYPDESYPAGLKDPSRPVAGTLPGIMSLPTTAWPDRTTQGDQDVLTCIAAHVNPVGPLPTPIEANYTNRNLAGSWSGWAAKITASGYFQTLTGYQGCGSLNQTDFANVTAQLNREWNSVPLVWSMITSMQSPLIDSQGNAAEIASIAAAVNQDIGTSSQSVSFNGDAVAADLLWIVSTLPGVSEFADPLNFLAGSLDLASDLNDNSDGVNLQQRQVTTTAANLGASLESQYTNTINGLNQEGDILVSDWTKLQDAAQNASNTTNAAADWSWNTQDATKATNQLLLATRQMSYKTLFPIRYSLYRLSAGAAAGSVNPQDVTSYTCAVFVSGTYNTTIYSWRPFSGVPQYGGAAPAVSGEGTIEQWVYSTPNSNFIKTANAKGQWPTETLLSGMFTAPTNDPVQIGPLFNILQFAVETYTNATTNTISVTHYHDSTGGIHSQTSDYFCRSS